MTAPGEDGSAGGVRRGVRLGVDVGTVRIGVAASDPSALLATPLETVRRGRGDVDRVVALAAEREVLEVVVGLPRHLSGAEGASAGDARTFAAALARRLAPVPVRLVDERLSTVTAQRGLRESGLTGKRAARTRRDVVDQAAAVVILQSALDAERGSGRPPGTVVDAGVGGDGNDQTSHGDSDTTGSSTDGGTR
ncbi:MAG TPA: Holliday junction resolvase RuvX [Motilibacteraceae bacterium]|nr:Holliday junction resolvase RuvX [Motilibacteraceae bacterium]